MHQHQVEEAVVQDSIHFVQKQVDGEFQQQTDVATSYEMMEVGRN